MINFLIENDQAPLNAPLVSELHDAEVVGFLPVFAFHAKECDEEPAKLIVRAVPVYINLLVLKKKLTSVLHFTM